MKVNYLCGADPTHLSFPIFKCFLIHTECFFQLTGDSVPEIRENSYNALGTAMKVVGEKHIMPFIADMDSIKQGKVT